MKGGLDEKMMTKFVKSRAKACSCLTDESNKDKSCVMKRKLVFENYKNCLEATQLKNKIHHPEKDKADIGSIKKIINNSKETKN